jgi:hypothetical protein
MNNAFEQFPQEAAISLLFCEISSIFATHQLILASGLDIPTSFALGFAVSRPFRRIRLPVELAFAATLKKLVPELAQVRMSTLIGGQVPSVVQANSTVAKIRRWRGTAAIADIIDKYGACYFIGARWTGVISVLLFTGLISNGVDIEPLLQRFGVTPTLGTQLGSWAAAVTLSSFLYPASMMVGGAFLAPALGGARQKYFIPKI